MSKYEQGFTLVEIMIVIAIVAVLATFALPSYREYVDRSRIRSCMQEASAYVKARAAAVLGGVTPLPVYNAISCVDGNTIIPVTSNDLNSRANFTARDSRDTVIECDWSTTSCSTN